MWKEKISAEMYRQRETCRADASIEAPVNVPEGVHIIAACRHTGPDVPTANASSPRDVESFVEVSSEETTPKSVDPNGVALQTYSDTSESSDGMVTTTRFHSWLLSKPRIDPM